MRHAVRPPSEALNTGPYVARSGLLGSIWWAMPARWAGVEYTLLREPGRESTRRPVTATQAGITTRSRRRLKRNRAPVPVSWREPPPGRTARVAAVVIGTPRLP